MILMNRPEYFTTYVVQSVCMLSTRLMFSSSIHQNPFQRMVKRMTRFHTKKDVATTLKKLKEVFDKLKYTIKINGPRQVRADGKRTKSLIM